MSVTTFTTIDQLKTFIQTYIRDNGNREITGDQVESALLGIIDLISPTLQQDLVVQLGAGGTVGGAYTNEGFTAGTTIEDVLRAILIKTVHPTYIAPTLVLQSDVLILDYEVGSLISPTFNIVFTQNDGGALSSKSLKKNGTQISAALPYTDSNVSIGTSNTVYQASVAYATGAVKNNNLGQPDAVGQIVAGTVNSNQITYKGHRKFFYGFPTTNPTTSANVRSLGNSVLDPQANQEITIPIPQGAVKVAFAYPASLGDIISVKYVESGNVDVKEIFVKTIFSVDGANAFAGVLYNVYVYTPVEPYPSAVTYIVKI